MVFMKTWFVFRETSFFWALPFRSGYSGVPPSPFFHVAGSFLTCNVTERLGQRCSLTIPNAEKRLPALCRDTCPRHGAGRQSGIPAPYITAALRSAVVQGFAGMACAADWLFAPRPTIIGITASWCLLIFFVSRYLHSAKFLVFECVEVVFSLQR